MNDTQRCGATRHGTEAAYKQHGCRCPELVERLRQAWRRQPARLQRNSGRSRGWRNGTDVDPVAVLRAMLGDRQVPLNTAERAEAIERLTTRNWTANQIADQLGVSQRTVIRHRAARRGVARREVA